MQTQSHSALLNKHKLEFSKQELNHFTRRQFLNIYEKIF